jgi:hypothetical protein
MGYTANIARMNSTSRGFTNHRLMGYAESHDEERLMYKNLQFGKKQKFAQKMLDERLDFLPLEESLQLKEAGINIGLLKLHLLNQSSGVKLNTEKLDKGLDKLINEVKDANKELDKLSYKIIVTNLIDYMKDGRRRSSLKFTTNKKRDSLLDDMSRRQSKIPSLRKSLFELRKNSESKQNDTQSRKNSKGWKSLLQEYNQKRLSTKKIGGAAKKSPEEKEREKEEKKKQKELEKEQKKKEKELEKEQKKKQKELEKEENKKQKKLEKEQTKKLNNK